MNIKDLIVAEVVYPKRLSDGQYGYAFAKLSDKVQDNFYKPLLLKALIEMKIKNTFIIDCLSTNELYVLIVAHLWCNGSVGNKINI